MDDLDTLIDKQWKSYRVDKHNPMHLRPYLTGNALEEIRSIIPHQQYLDNLVTPLLLCDYNNFALEEETNASNVPYLYGIDIFQEMHELVPKITDTEMHGEFLHFLFQKLFIPEYEQWYKTLLINWPFAEFYLSNAGTLWEDFLSDYLPTIDEYHCSDIERMCIVLREAQYAITRGEFDNLLLSFTNQRKNQKHYIRFLNEKLNLIEDSKTKDESCKEGNLDQPRIYNLRSKSVI